MTNIVLRDNLFEDLFDFRREFDKIFNRMLTVKPTEKEQAGPFFGFNFAPAIEAFVDKEAQKYVCKVALPGIEPKDVQIHVLGNLLNIKGERKFFREAKDTEYMYKEFAYGKLEREFELPECVI